MDPVTDDIGGAFEGSALPPRPALEQRRNLPGARRIALGALLVALGGAVIAVAAGSRSSPPTTPATPARPANAATTAGAVRTFDADIGDQAGCQTLSASEPQLLCPFPGGVVTYTQVTDVGDAHRRVEAPARSAAGEAACATRPGHVRTWARPQAPEQEAGRYVCRVEDAVAEIWWTVDDARVLGHAIRRDGDVTALFSWWRARSEHP